MNDIIKYPRTRHIEGSRLQKGDEDLKSERFETIRGKYLVLEEKIDGANSGISFSPDGKLLLQSRGHFLNGGYGEKQFDLFKTWASVYESSLYELLGSRYIMYGEWMYAKHTIFYDNLPHYFMEFDIYDKEKHLFLSTKERRNMLKNYSFISSVRVLYEGRIESLEELTSYLGPSAFRTERCLETLKQQSKKCGLSEDLVLSQTDQKNLMEGIYIKEEDDKHVIDRYKFVRASFLTSIANSETHWADRPIVPNLLGHGFDLFDSGNGVQD